jgi:hypothetical protein
MVTYLAVDHGLDVDHASTVAEQHILVRGMSDCIKNWRLI